MFHSNNLWMTVADAAEQAKVSAWTIYRACELGELRHVRLGGRRAIRLTREALDDWLLQHERAAIAPATNTAGASSGHEGASQIGGAR